MPKGKPYQAGMSSSPKGAGSHRTIHHGSGYRKLGFASKSNYAPPRHGTGFGDKGSGSTMQMGHLVKDGDRKHGMGM